MTPALPVGAAEAARRSVDCLVGAVPRGEIEAWFARPQRCLGGCRPRDLLLAGQGELVVHAARRTGRVLRVRSGR